MIINDEIQKKIEIKIENIEENIKYQIDAQCETLSDLKTLRYLMLLLKNITE